MRRRARMSKRRAQIADRVAEFVAVISAQLQNHVVRVFQVPVVNQRHQDLQTLQLLSADKRILFHFHSPTRFQFSGRASNLTLVKVPLPGIVTRGTR